MIFWIWIFCAKMNFLGAGQEKNLVYGTKYFSDPPHIHSAILEFFAHFGIQQTRQERNGRTTLSLTSSCQGGGNCLEGHFWWFWASGVTNNENWTTEGQRKWSCGWCICLSHVKFTTKYPAAGLRGRHIKQNHTGRALDDKKKAGAQARQACCAGISKIMWWMSTCLGRPVVLPMNTEVAALHKRQ